MGIFTKKPKVEVCDMCGKAEVEGCGGVDKHVVVIKTHEPEWMPGDLRAQGLAEFTWLCLRCNSYPAMKWPSHSGAGSGMIGHLATAHHLGPMKDLADALPRMPFDMIRVQ